MSRWESSLPIQEEIPLHFEFIVVTVSNSSGLLTGSFLVLQTGAITKLLLKDKRLKRHWTIPHHPDKANPETINGFPTYLSMSVFSMSSSLCSGHLSLFSCLTSLRLMLWTYVWDSPGNKNITLDIYAFSKAFCGRWKLWCRIGGFDAVLVNKKTEVWQASIV